MVLAIVVSFLSGVGVGMFIMEAIMDFVNNRLEKEKR